MNKMTMLIQPREPLWVAIVRPFAIAVIWLFFWLVIARGIRRGLVMGK